MIYIFPDTNMFLHYKPFAQVNWTEVSSDFTDPITVVVPSNTIEELDKQKDNGKTRGIRKRALDALKLLETAPIDGTALELKTSLYLSIDTDDPSEFAKYKLSPNKPDDNLLCSALEFSEAHKGERVVLLTHDTTPRLKAKRKGLEAFNGPDSWKLPDSMDEEQKELLDLRRELDMRPSLRASMVGGALHINIAMPSPPPSSTSLVDKVLRKLLEETPPLQVHSNPFLSMAPGAAMDYNQELQFYQTECRLWLHEALEYAQVMARTVRVQVEITNTGRIPVNDINVELEFPSDLEMEILPHVEELSEPPFPPFPPALSSILNLPVQQAEPQQSKLLADLIQNLNSNTGEDLILATVKNNIAKFRIKEIAQEESASLAVYACFEDYDDIQSFSIRCKTKCKEVAPAEVNLQLHLTKQSSRHPLLDIS